MLEIRELSRGIEDVGKIRDAFIKFKFPVITVLPVRDVLAEERELVIVVLAFRFLILDVVAVNVSANRLVKYPVIAVIRLEKKLVVVASVMLALVALRFIILLLVEKKLVAVALVATNVLVTVLVATRLLIVAVPVAVILLPVASLKKRFLKYPVMPVLS